MVVIVVVVEGVEVEWCSWNAMAMETLINLMIVRIALADGYGRQDGYGCQGGDGCDQCVDVWEIDGMVLG